MPVLHYQGREVTPREGESVLDAFMRQGVTIPFSCRNGSCHVCLQQCTFGTIPPVAQQGLRLELRKQGYFLACQCIPVGDMNISPPAGLYRATFVHHKEMLSPRICRLLIEPPADFVFHPGQFINLRRRDSVTRSYSLAGLPQDYFLELHIQRKNGGVLSNWILDELMPGDEIEIQGANGDSHYQDENSNDPLLMIATGTGLAPLLGILRVALQQRHGAAIHLYHGSRQPEGLYLDQSLRKLAKQHANFHYYPCVSEIAPTDITVKGIRAGRAHEIAFAEHRNLRGWQVYLAGLPEMVENAERLAIERGAPTGAIHCDAFMYRDLRNKSRSEKPVAIPMPRSNKTKYPPPNSELWAALCEGKLLTAILTEFYGLVYQDPRLASFFEGVTKQRLIEKQFLFIRQILTGEKIYFGDQPRNTHHWMVISDELFDYRGNIMRTCLNNAGLSQTMIERFLAIEEYYRADIVKMTPFPKLIGDTAMPLEGFDKLIIDIGTLCDSCKREVAAGETVIYHVRLGKIYCSNCSTPHQN